MLTPAYPPMRGGISAYTAQAVLALRDEGHEVAVAAPEGAEAAITLDVRGRGAGITLVRVARRCDRLIVQFQPEMLGDPGSPRSARARALMRMAGGLWAARDAELCVHEVDPGAGPLAPLVRALTRRVFGLADRFTVHTEREREDLSGAFKVDRAKIRVVSQGAYMVRWTTADQSAARAALGLPADGRLLLAIGFLHPRKGFDRAIRSFAQAGSDGARLYVVGSLWREDDTALGHLDELRRLAGETPGAELRVGHLTDEEFDRWIVASDALVLPYVSGWSSNVMERGLLYDRPVIMSDLGGMSEQGVDRPGVTLVGDDVALGRAVRQAVEVTAPPAV